MAQGSDDDSPAGSLFSDDENPTAHCTDLPPLISPSYLPSISSGAAKWQRIPWRWWFFFVFWWWDSCNCSFYQFFSPFSSNGPYEWSEHMSYFLLHRFAKYTTFQLGREFSKRDRSSDSEFAIRQTKRSKIALKSTIALALSPPTNLLVSQRNTIPTVRPFIASHI